MKKNWSCCEFTTKWHLNWTVTWTSSDRLLGVLNLSVVGGFITNSAESAKQVMELLDSNDILAADSSGRVRAIHVYIYGCRTFYSN